MFDPGGVGEWSPPQSPQWGDNRGEEKKKRFITFKKVDLFGKPQRRRAHLR